MRDAQNPIEKSTLPLEEIGQRAWEICLKQGEDYPAIEDWLTAEQELLRERSHRVSTPTLAGAKRGQNQSTRKPPHCGSPR
jgi:hypothetical protein